MSTVSESDKRATSEAEAEWVSAVTALAEWHCADALPRYWSIDFLENEEVDAWLHWLDCKAAVTKSAENVRSCDRIRTSEGPILTDADDQSARRRRSAASEADQRLAAAWDALTSAERQLFAWRRTLLALQRLSGLEEQQRANARASIREPSQAIAGCNGCRPGCDFLARVAAVCAQQPPGSHPTKRAIAEALGYSREAFSRKLGAHNVTYWPPSVTA